MGRKRGNGSGSVSYHAAKGKWRAEVRWVDPSTGRVRSVTRYAPTRKEAETLLAELLLQRGRGLLLEPDRTTLRDWAQRWLQRKAREVKPKTLLLYTDELALALPSLKNPKARDPLGSKPLQKVWPAHIQEVLDALLERYSPRTVRKVRERLRAVFQEALALEMVARNPVDPVRVKGGEPSRPRGRALELREVAALLEALEAHPDPRTALALRLCLACGLRRGEVLGLRWEDLDLEAGTLTVRRTVGVIRGKGVVGTPKTQRAYRTVPIPHATLLRLRGYRDWLLAKGVAPEDLPELWVFPGNDPSRPLDPNTLNHTLRRIAQRLGLPPLRVHDLRHSYGSHLLANGAPLEVVAERMGHASPTITLGIYRHVLEHERQGWVLDPEDLLRAPGRARA
ncbi:site-specific recombinase XerD [Thermus oshimai JL-2]|uniref:Site-specific recombinase XerD n=1 Tax=Thermus oshimai JL-2 TaxID=751945 RepID=K7QZM1_THEOS|nr:site-specific integrase [Thermus oshimai]AFV76340.1 site-specific recombinase XerD [Thermus oshimai JL-2]